MGKKLNKQIVHSSIIATLVFLAIITLDAMGGFQRLEWISYDWRMQAHRADVKAPDDIAVILIDEPTLKTLNPIVGRWPWPRFVHADVLDFISLGNPKAIVLDILFTENEVNHDTPDELSENDARLVESSDNGLTHHAAQLFKDTADEINQTLLDRPLPENGLRFSFKTNISSTFQNNNKYSLPFPELLDATKGLGIVNVPAGKDGIYRKVPLFHRYQTSVFPSLGLSALIDNQEQDALQFGNTMGYEGRFAPVDDKHLYLINFYGDITTYSMSGIITSANQVLTGELENLVVDPYEFENKIVFIGASAAALQDLKSTPLSPTTPGVMLHASTAGNFITGDFLKPLEDEVVFLFCLLLSVITTFVTLLTRRIIIKLIIPAFLFSVTLIGIYYAFKFNIVITMVMPLTTIVLAAAIAITYLVFTEGRDKRRIRTMLAQYVSPAVLTEVVDHYEEHLRAEIGREECLSVLFSDIRGFTNLSERIPPNQLVETLNFYFSNMTDAIFEHDGTIDKFIGDAIMAFWGAPIKDADHARKSVAAAIEMTKRLQQVNQWLTEKSYPEISIGIGINTGDVVIGNIGSSRKLDYTVIGDNVNLASRLEGLTKPYGCSIIISEFTFEQLQNSLPCCVVDAVRVKGKEHPIRVYSPLVEQTSIIARKEAMQIEIGFYYYQQQQWQKAIDAYNKISNSALKEMFISRCENYLQHPPGNQWDGVHTMTEK